MTSKSLNATFALAAATVISSLALAPAAYSAPASTAGRATTANAPASAGRAPDLVLIHGVVLTMNAQGMIAEAVAVSGDQITDVGTTARIKALAGPSTRVIDLEGKTLLPGFVDPRVLGPFGFWETFAGISLTAGGGVPAGTQEEIQVPIATWMEAHKPAPGAWVVAAGFNPRMALSRKLKRDFADRIAPDNPLLILSLDHHVALLNAKGIAAVGLKDLKFPEESGEVERDASGEPTGFLREAPVFLVMNAIWERLPDQARRDATAAFNAAAGRFGLTTAGIPLAGPADAAAAEALLKQGDLSVRTVLQPFALNRGASQALEAYGRDGKSPDPDRILIGPAIQVIDGTPMGGGAALFQPYKDARWTSGTLNVAPDEVDALVASWHAGQAGVAFEASGSLASHVVLDATERAVGDGAPGAWTPGRPVLRVDGFDLVSAHDRSRLPILARAGAVVAVQPSLLPFRIFMANAIGDERMQDALPYKSLVDAGVSVALSSDWPMTSQTFQPTQLVEWAVTRTGFRKEEALRASTAGAARALGLDARIGSIEPGKKADFVVLDRDPLDPSIKPEDLSEIPVRMTFLGGSIVYEDRTTASAAAPRRPANSASAGGR